MSEGQKASDWIRCRVSQTSPTTAEAWLAEIEDKTILDQNRLASTSAVHLSMGLRKPSAPVSIQAGMTVYSLHVVDGIQLHIRDFGVTDFTANATQVHDIETVLAFIHASQVISYWFVSAVVSAEPPELVIRTISGLPFGSAT